MELESNKEGSFIVRVARIADTEGPEEGRPIRIYHYCNLETAIEKILPFQRLLLGPYENTNDPRENRTFRFAAISPPEQEDFKANNWPGRLSKILRDGCKVTCFSTDFEEFFGHEYSRMWAYYGGNHRGVCIELDTETFIEENCDKVNQNQMRRIQYQKMNLKEPPSHKTVDFGRVEDIGFEDYLKNEFRKDHLKYLYFTKDYEWKSEREYRLIHFSDSTEHEYCSIEKSLTKIYFGTEFNDIYIPAIRKICPGIPLFKMRYSDFRLVPLELIP